ncbi:hypothetical protein BgiMline_007024 [Biomphalaria glabrata]|nr:hypothetical protein BgiMline_022612 [Biomphalaria glabrata]
MSDVAYRPAHCWAPGWLGAGAANENQGKEGVPACHASGPSRIAHHLLTGWKLAAFFFLNPLTLASLETHRGLASLSRGLAIILPPDLGTPPTQVSLSNSSHG